jgi:hypothetical protein
VLPVSLVGLWVNGLVEKQSHFVFVPEAEGCALEIELHFTMIYPMHGIAKKRGGLPRSNQIQTFFWVGGEWGAGEYLSPGWLLSLLDIHTYLFSMGGYTRVR